MKKQVSVAYLVSGLLFSTCLIEATAGLLIFPISYIVNDIIAEVWGYRKARLIIWYGFLMNFLAVAVFRLSILVPGSENFTHQEAFSLVMGNTLRITIASFIAFLIGSFLNAFVMSKMKIMYNHVVSFNVGLSAYCCYCTTAYRLPAIFISPAAYT